MKEHSRIRFNPVTKEIEIEGSESFVKDYFSRLQAMISGSPEKSMSVKEKPIKVKAAQKKKAKVAKISSAPAKKTKKAAKKKSGKKKVTHIDAVVTLIQKSSEGISTAVLKEKTGLAESQIWNIVNRATKEGKVKKIKRGLYGKA